MLINSVDSAVFRVFASGGMGNQLFQYSFLCFIEQEIGLNVEFVNLKIPRKPPHLNFDLTPFINHKSFTSQVSTFLPKRMLPVVDPWHSFRIHQVWGHRYDFRFAPRLSPDCMPEFPVPGHIVGYFQNYEFVSRAKDTVREVLLKLAKQPLNPFPYKEDYEAIHIRGGDFLKKKNRNYMGNLSRQYYSSILSRKSNLPRVVISDDDFFAQKLLEGINIDYYVNPVNNKFQEALFILSNARRIYISNSTFSWFGGFLGKEAKDAEVFLPEPFFKSEKLNSSTNLLSPAFRKIPAIWH